MFDKYIQSISPIPIEKIEVSPNNPYLYRITAFASLVNENRKAIDERFYKNKKINSYEGWFLKKDDIFFKQALIEFKKSSKKEGQ